MRLTITWFVGLLVAWLMLSGIFQPLLLFFGLLSCLIVLWIKHRIRRSNFDSVEIGKLPLDILPLLRYWLWLAKEVVVANIDVTRCVLSRSMPVSPSVFVVPTTGLNDYGKVIYANSITLTPGTISLDIGKDEIVVHALLKESVASMQQSTMRDNILRCPGARN